MRNGRAGASELTFQLDDPNELFEPRAADVLAGRPPRVSAIDEIHDELRAHPGAAATVTVVLPPDKATPEAERGLREAVGRYCSDGIAAAEHELEAIRHDGIQTLLFGVAVLAVGLLLSESVLRSKFPKELRDFLGNGLFLVVAWVGLWYPLDTLIYSGRPYRAELRVLRAMARLQIIVRTPGERPLTPPAVETAPQSLTGG